MTTVYQPGSVPGDPNLLPGFLRRELHALKYGTDAPTPSTQRTVLYAEPSRMLPGMEVLADGTTWDPGSGEGVYRRDVANAAWVFLGLEVPVSVANGGTGSTTAADARTALGLAYGPVFSAYGNANQGVTSSVSTKVQINTEEFDTNTNYDPTTNYRFTPTVAGYYQINGRIRASATNMTAAFVLIYKNGAEYERVELNIPATTTTQVVGISSLISMNGSTDYVELYGFITGTDPVLQVVTQANSCRFSGALVRPA